jgi:hypothetical protein
MPRDKSMRAARQGLADTAALRRLAATFFPGQRVELHPATTWWMRGARFGTVVGSFRQFVRVELDMRPGDPVFVNPENLIQIE